MKAVTCCRCCAVGCLLKQILPEPANERASERANLILSCGVGVVMVCRS